VAVNIIKITVLKGGARAFIKKGHFLRKYQKKPKKKLRSEAFKGVFSYKTTFMLNKSGFLTFVIFKRREKKVNAWCP